VIEIRVDGSIERAIVMLRRQTVKDQVLQLLRVRDKYPKASERRMEKKRRAARRRKKRERRGPLISKTRGRESMPDPIKEFERRHGTWQQI